MRKSTSIFTNKKSIIQLLKKSLLSIGIDKKKEILNILDEIQLQVDQSDPRIIKEHFGRLIAATCEMCVAQDCHQILHEALRTFMAIASNIEAHQQVVIEKQILEQTMSKIRQVFATQADEQTQSSPNADQAVGLSKHAGELYSCLDIDSQ